MNSATRFSQRGHRGERHGADAETGVQPEASDHYSLPLQLWADQNLQAAAAFSHSDGIGLDDLLCLTSKMSTVPLFQRT